ncbi:hypothetical protein BD769DRAFT_1397046 [Suillus cothurnatus]|nr:hypothetical protein BD769DRAFT_1397046 [Suillus cothurnatus]
MDETKKRWEAALREREEKLAMAHKELEDNRAQQQQQLQDHIRESGKVLSQANHASIEASMQQILDNSRERLTQELVQQEAKLGQELAQCEEELSRKKNEEVEKECELANMEQRFAEHHRLQDLDIDMDTSHSRRKDAGQQSTPSTNPFSGTSCLDMIKRIRRSHGVSHRTCLVSVAVDMDAVPQEQSSKQDIPPHNQHNTPPIASMEDAVARVHEPASHQDVYAYEYEDGSGPDPRHPAFDLQNGSKSSWNSRIINLLLEELEKRGREDSWPFQRSEVYLREILQHRYKCLHMIWTAVQPRITAKGALETPAEVEERLIAKKDETLKLTRQTTRRKNKYLWRVTVLDHLIKQMSDENREDLPAWQWLQLLVKTLGEGGMSSEESDIENQIETELDIVNHQRLMDDDIFAPQGSKPMKWIYAAGNPTTSRAQVDELPKALYNAEWLAGLTKHQAEKLSISTEKLKWMKVAVV